MPELPEVETTRLAIAPLASGRRIRTLKVYDGRLRWPVPLELPKLIAGDVVQAVDRRARYLLLRLDSGTLIVHFGMTGSLRYYVEARERETHEHWDLVFDDGSLLRYRDPRRFGALLHTPEAAETHPLLAHIGPEPLSAAFTAESLYMALHSRRTAVKLALMDNAVVAGVGNIYANEALFRAGIRPGRAAHRVSRGEVSRLAESVVATLRDALAAGGSTLRDYVDGQGRAGYFQLQHFVYGRRHEPCRVCGTLLREIRQGGRASFYCPRCQK